MLLTPRDLQVGLSDQSRSSLVVLAVPNPAHGRYFTFETPVDFATCMPAEQEPEGEAGSEKPRAEQRDTIGSAAS